VKYLALIYASDEDWASVSEAEREATYAEYRAFAEAGGDRIVNGYELQPAATATTVRVRGDETVVTDGPFVETKEQLGGYFVLDCGSVEEAIELAAKIPGARRGTIEVRPSYVDDAAEHGEEAAA